MRLGAVELLPSDAGRFEVTLDGRVMFSKVQLARHAEPGEVLRRIQQALEEGG